jgi:hypothetical protein
MARHPPALSRSMVTFLSVGFLVGCAGPKGAWRGASEGMFNERLESVARSGGPGKIPTSFVVPPDPDHGTGDRRLPWSTTGSGGQRMDFVSYDQRSGRICFSKVIADLSDSDEGVARAMRVESQPGTYVVDVWPTFKGIGRRSLPPSPPGTALDSITLVANERELRRNREPLSDYRFLGSRTIVVGLCGVVPVPLAGMRYVTVSRKREAPIGHQIENEPTAFVWAISDDEDPTLDIDAAPAGAQAP